ALPILPQYTVVATHGAAHNQEFEVECSIPALAVVVNGRGASRRAAEQEAAHQALTAVQNISPGPARRTRAHKSSQLSLPVAVAQRAASQSAVVASPAATAPAQPDKTGDKS